MRFTPRLDDLFSYSLLVPADSSQVAGSYSASAFDASTSTVAVGVLDMCRQFVDKCLANQTRQRQNAQRLAGAIVELMTMMTNDGVSMLRTADITVLFKWVQVRSSLFRFCVYVCRKMNNKLIRYCLTD